MARMVIALGGNALGKTPQEQLKAVQKTACSLVELLQEGHELILTHGNGPQVGMIKLAFESTAVPEMPLPECGAMSQGYIGYHLQNALDGELRKKGLFKSVATIITRVLVDPQDPAFAHPSKPIGSFYSKEEAEKIRKEKGYSMIDDAGRGYRRVVPSPLPVDIAEKELIQTLVENDHLVIACGGGGIPVIKKGTSLEGVPAVIDKDFASEKLAELVGAEYLVILTAVEKVALNFGQEKEKWLSRLSPETAEEYIAEGHFAPGSMLPKVKAALKFVRSQQGRKALITSLEKAKAGLRGETGTMIS